MGYPGEAPWTRGFIPGGYRQQLWKTEMYAGFGSAEEANQRYRYLMSQGSTGGISIALDLPTQVGYDSDHPLAHGEVFPGIAALLRRLSERQYPLAVVTNKPTRLARAVVAAAGLLPWFAQVQGADSAAQRKPSPAMLQTTATQLGVTPSQLLMVGDAPPDMLAASAAGCPAALVSWGYGAHSIPAGLSPWCVDRPEQIGDRLLS